VSVRFPSLLADGAQDRRFACEVLEGFSPPTVKELLRARSLPSVRWDFTSPKAAFDHLCPASRRPRGIKKLGGGVGKGSVGSNPDGARNEKGLA